MTGTVVGGVIGHDVVAALTLPAAPQQVSAIRTYRPCVARGCHARVVFTAGGRVVDTPYAGGFFGIPTMGRASPSPTTSVSAAGGD